MKQSLIHPGFFREMFRQLRAKGLVATLLLAGLNLILFSVYLTRDPVNVSVGHFDARLMALPMLVMLYLFVPIMVFGAYRWLNKRVESDFYHAIPLTRTQIYATTSAAIFLWLMIALGIYAVVQAILRTAFGLPINYLLFLCVFVNMLIAMIEIVAAFSIGCALCGRRFTAFFQSVAVLFLPRIILTAFWILTEVDSGFTLPFSMILPFFNPEYNIAATPLHSLIYGINYTNPLAMLYSLVYSTGLLVLGGVAFFKRRSELAEIPYASKALQTVTRVMFGMPQLAAITVILNIWMRYGWEEDFLTSEILIPLILTSILFSFLFYCLYELISSRKMKKVVKAMPGYVLCLALSAFFIFVPFWIGKLRVLMPIDAEEIKSFKISNESTLLIPSGISGSETWTDYVMYHHAFSDRAASKLIASQSKEDCTEQQKGESVNFTDMQRIIVNNGGLFKKMVNLPSYSGKLKTKDKLLKICKNDPAFGDALVAYPKGQITYYAQGLTLAEAREVGRLFRADYEKLTDEERLSLMYSPDSMIEMYGSVNSPVGLRIALFGSYGAENYTMTYRVNELTPNAAKAMLGYLNARNAEKARKELKALVEWMEHPKGDFTYTYFTVGTREVNGYYNLWNYEDQKEFATPKEAHPGAYAILKALSEAPTTDDPSHCVTFSIVSYEMSSLSSVTTQAVAAGFAVDDTLLAYIEQWIVAYDSSVEFPMEFLDL